MIRRPHIASGQESVSDDSSEREPLLDGDVGTVGVPLDITDRIQREEELQASLALLNATFDSISEGVLAIDPMLNARAVNRRFADMFGFDHEELLEMEPAERRRRIFQQAVDPEASEARAAAHTDANESERVITWDLKDGRTLQTRGVPQRLGDEILGFVVSVRDITEQVRATTLLEGQAAVLEDIARDRPLDEVLDELCTTVAQHIPGSLASVLLVEENGMRLRATAAPGLEAFYDEIGSVAIGDGVGSCGTSAFRGSPVVTEDIATDPFWESYATVALRYGLGACWSVPIRSAGGTVLGTFAAYQRAPSRPTENDLRLVETWASLAAVAIEREQAARTRRELEDRVRQAEKMESVGRLAGGLAHDLGNVLSAVTANCEVLRHQVVSGPGKEALDDLEDAATMAGRLVDDLLNLMRPARPELVDVQALILEMRSLFETVVGPSVAVEFALEAKHSWSRLDLPQFRQVLLNLVLNAKDAMPDGGRLSIRTENGSPRRMSGRGSSLLLSIEDTGHGMDQETQARAFEPFFTTKSGRGAKGVGLGLASASAAITRVGGAISCETKVGRGTTMQVQVPLAADPNESAEGNGHE